MLSPLKKLDKIEKCPTWGFDVEVTNKNKEFVCCSFVNDKMTYTFLKKQEAKDFVLKQEKALFIATNLEFDALALFGDEDNNLNPFQPFYRDSMMISGKIVKQEKRQKRILKFIDTLNFAMMSVKAQGDFLGIPKLESPDFNDTSDISHWIRYNVRDSYISYKFYEYLKKAFFQIGGKIKSTIASTSMDIFKRNYLDRKLKRPNLEIIEKMRKGYYGGRVEAFKRGYITKQDKIKVYDFNSLYPSVMINHFPNPNYLRFKKQGLRSIIEEFEGISEVELVAPYNYYPFLPVKDEKLLFPYGKIKGWYSHVELRKAFELGYELKKVKEQFYYSRIFYPFVGFVNDLYDLRQEYKRNNNPLELAVKIVLNSLYGKFAQRTDVKLDIKHIDNMKRNDWSFLHEMVDNYCILKIPVTEKNCSGFINPILSIYTTAYARIKLYDAMLDSNAIYVDTDSVFTSKELDSSNKLGDLKLEATIDTGVIVKPKMYSYNGKVKLKGFSRATDDDFKLVINGGVISYQKFAKFKETLRSIKGFYFNKPVQVEKKFDLEDSKRKWDSLFNPDILQNSTPKCVI